MAISIEFADDAALHARIKVVGVGGSGGNALNTMIASGLEGVEFIAANTDAQALESNLAPIKIQLGPQLTKGLGAGGNPEIGRKSALEDVQRLAEVLAGADMVFVTAGMGGGTGTGAAPIVAQIARDAGALTVGVVTKPFSFEGNRRGKNAIYGIRELVDSVDSIITIPNEKLLLLGDDDLSMLDAFQRADDVLLQAVQGISDLIINHGMINVDFADVKTIMSYTGRALMGTGYAKGEHRALNAAQYAINSPLLDDITIDGAKGILLSFTAGPDIKLREINEAASLVQAAAHEDVEIIFGVVTDPDMNDTVKVTVIATGFEDEVRAAAEAHGAQSALQQQLTQPGRFSMPAARGTRPSTPAFRDAIGSSRPSRRPNEAPRQASVPPAPPVPTRAFGASALHDEAVLDIPAYMRRSTPAATRD